LPSAIDVVAVLARFVHVGGACLVTGIFAFVLFVARPAIRATGAATRGRLEALDSRLLTMAVVTIAVILGAGLVDLGRQALVATGGTGERLAWQTIGPLLAETRFGDIWLVRHALWLLLGALLLLRGPERNLSDWLALTLAGLTLAAAALAAGAASGHAATAPERTNLSIAADAVHLVATGIWAGALVPFILFLRSARPASSETVPPLAAAVAVRWFSTLGLSAVVVLVASGVYAVVQQVGNVPALLGTTYGRWLLLKLALLLPLLGVALVNRTRLKPRLEKAAASSDGSDAAALVTRLTRFVLLEALFVAAILGAVAVLGLTTPARHDAVHWPLPFRFAWDANRELSAFWARVTIGGQLAIAALIASLIAVVIRRRWWRPVLAGGAAAVALGLAVALPRLAVDAYPTTYIRPALPYTTTSIARGHALYRDHCASCHGMGEPGDNPAASSLTGRRTAEHTAGDLFWWLTHGIAGSAMPAFVDRLSPDQRWDVVNFVRGLAAAEQGRDLAPHASDRPTIVAPDLRYTTGVGAERSLREYRRSIVHLVFFRVPESFERLSRLGRRHFDFRLSGAEIIGVPLHDASTIYRALGARPVLFPIVVEGAEPAAVTYGLFRRHLAADRWANPGMPAHMEMLIDRQGYLRARWIPSGSPDAAGGWNDLDALLREIGRLSQEPSLAPIPGEHIH
jgi:putative copper resistance protein D